ncbi:MAG: class I SAM-dependent RNA methyltransferase [Alphaproteobacteria bacterium]|nr:class I SAM-dependent RNA methyltransferase [Alphaproteobacteria bacterium]
MSETLDLTIDDLGAQGDGIAHQNGLTFFVTGTLPGERVKVRPGARQGQQQRAEVLEVLNSSPERATPPCPHFLRCGGCRLQHMNAAAYIGWKLRQLRQTLEQAGLHDVPLLPAAVSAPATRRRARLGAKHGKDGIVLGFNEWRSHDLVNVKACPVLLPELVSFIQRLREKFPRVLPAGKACDIQITGLPDGFDVAFIGGPPLNLEQRQNLASLAEELDIAQLSWRKWDRSPVEPVAFRLPLSVQYGETRVPFPSGSFLQATATGEKTLIDFAKRSVGHVEKIADLFCGLGGFGLAMTQAKRIHFADVDGPANAALGAAVRQQPRLRVEQRNLISSPYCADDLNAFNAVIFDPPRGGAKAQAAALAQSRAPHIAAISCDPPSFARDAKILMQGGYKLQSLLPVDQFLWSTHLELAAHFAR